MDEILFIATFYPVLYNGDHEVVSASKRQKTRLIRAVSEQRAIEKLENWYRREADGDGYYSLTHLDISEVIE